MPTCVDAYAPLPGTIISNPPGYSNYVKHIKQLQQATPNNPSWPAMPPIKTVVNHLVNDLTRVPDASLYVRHSRDTLQLVYFCCHTGLIAHLSAAGYSSATPISCNAFLVRCPMFCKIHRYGLPAQPMHS